jgi:hypothetical protein
MTKTDLTRDMRAYTGAGVISVSQLSKYLGYKEDKYVKAKFLKGLQPVTDKKYFIPDVVEAIMARRFL